jgi:protein-disulfide isomerase
MRKNRFWRLCVPVVSVLLWAVPVGGVHAQGAGAGADEEKLILRLKQEIMKELREGGLVRREVERGIQEYVRKQVEAQQAQQRAAREKAERETAERLKKVRRVSKARDHIQGDPNAPFSLIEYSDYECPFCKRFHETARTVVDSHGGKVNWVYRHFPLFIHDPGATKQAEASECVNELGGNKAFWTYTDTVYARTQSNGKSFPKDRLMALVKEIGIDSDAFRKCFESGRKSARVQQDLEDGKLIGISGTPTSVLLNNRTGEARLVTGAVPPANLRSAIEGLLKTAKK